MNINLTDLLEYKVYIQEEEVGKIEDFYFDENLWVIRYMVVNTGNWLIKNLVLLSPVSVDEIDNQKKAIKLCLTKEQLENSPDVNFKIPISREKEIELSKYYNTGFYWIGYHTWGAVPYPITLRNINNVDMQKASDSIEENNHLRSVKEVLGYHIMTQDGELGHIKDFIMNQDNWSLDFFILNTRNILPGDDVVFNVRWIGDINWDTQRVYVKYTKEFVTERVKE